MLFNLLGQPQARVTDETNNLETKAKAECQGIFSDVFNGQLKFISAIAGFLTNRTGFKIYD